MSRRTFADVLLFGVTSAELALLFVLTPTFTVADWIYVGQNLVVLAIAVARGSPAIVDRSVATGIAVVTSYAYPYAQVAYLWWIPG